MKKIITALVFLLCASGCSDVLRWDGAKISKIGNEHTILAQKVGNLSVGSSKPILSWRFAPDSNTAACVKRASILEDGAEELSCKVAKLPFGVVVVTVGKVVARVLD